MFLGKHRRYDEALDAFEAAMKRLPAGDHQRGIVKTLASEMCRVAMRPDLQQRVDSW